MILIVIILVIVVVVLGYIINILKDCSIEDEIEINNLKDELDNVKTKNRKLTSKLIIMNAKGCACKK